MRFWFLDVVTSVTSNQKEVIGNVQAFIGKYFLSNQITHITTQFIKINMQLPGTISYFK